MLCEQATKWNHYVYARLFKAPIFQCSTKTSLQFINLKSGSHMKLHTVYNLGNRMYNIQIKISIKFQTEDDWQMTNFPL